VKANINYYSHGLAAAAGGGGSIRFRGSYGM